MAKIVSDDRARQGSFGATCAGGADRGAFPLWRCDCGLSDLGHDDVSDIANAGRIESTRHWLAFRIVDARRGNASGQ